MSAVAAKWTVIAHPCFVEQLEELVAEVEYRRSKDPINYLHKNAAKRLGAILKLAFEDIPADPTSPAYRQGDTLGDDYKHWRRAKFFQQYRLFFRYHLEARIVVLAWVNDEGTKRAYDSKSDAYRVFKQMLAAGHPPDDWDALVREAKADADGLSKALKKVSKTLPGANNTVLRATGQGDVAT